MFCFRQTEAPSLILGGAALSCFLFYILLPGRQSGDGDAAWLWLHSRTVMRPGWWGMDHWDQGWPGELYERPEVPPNFWGGQSPKLLPKCPGSCCRRRRDCRDIPSDWLMTCHFPSVVHWPARIVRYPHGTSNDLTWLVQFKEPKAN